MRVVRGLVHGGLSQPGLSNRDRVGRGFGLLAEGLLPFVDRCMAAVAPSGTDWPALLARRDQRDGRAGVYDRHDPQTLLRVLTEERRSFKDALSPRELAYASELRDIRNNWAHNRPFSDRDTERALDTIERLLTAAGAVPQAEAVQRLLHDHRRAEFDRLTRRRAKQAAAPEVEEHGLKPWREVIRPHDEVARGEFSLAEFAADLNLATTVEVGGPNGERALQALQNVVRRAATGGRPASPQESFEIVRRRLFQEPSGAARGDIAVVARRFSQFYNEHRGEFPSWCAEPDYEARIRAAYPIHPELFDRLYENWSALERFHRTRGVLRLMSAVIFALRNSSDRSPLIMPGTLPLEDTFAASELTQYLEDNWKSIIDVDVAGPDSTPARIDVARPTFGQRQITRRLARTIFFGSAATLRSAHKGIDQQRIWLGTAMPGDTVGNFGSALHVLQDQATYLYSDGSRYWYDTQASVTRTARDYAEWLKERPEAVWAEITARLERQVKRPRGDFASVLPAPEGSGDIPDSNEARLVLLHPRYAHKRNGEDSAAMRFVREALDSRGSSQRVHRNMLVFLAPDEKRLEELMATVREYLAWRSVCERVTELDLSPTQQNQAENRRKRANEAVDQRIGATYIWVLAPEQRDPTRPVTWQTLKVESASTDLADRVSTRLRGEGALSSVHVSRNIHHYLTGPLASVWQRGHVSVGELWRYYTHHPYLPRLRDQSVLRAGVLDVLTSIPERRPLSEVWDGPALWARCAGLCAPAADCPRATQA